MTFRDVLERRRTWLEGLAPGGARGAAGRRATLLLVGAAAAAAAIAFAAPGGLAPAVSRAALAVAGIGVVAVLARRAPARTPAALRVVTRTALAREAGIAVVEVENRRLLLGFGAGGVRVLARLDGAGGEGGRP